MSFVRIALRNVMRHRRRSILTGAAIVLGFALLLIATGLGDGAHEAMAEVGVRMGLGHTIVQAAGYEDDPSLDRMIHDPAPIERALRQAGPEVMYVAPRLHVDGLLQAGAQSMGVLVSGVDPAVEPHVSKIESREAMVAGTPLGGPAADQTSTIDAALPPVVIGKRLASTLGAGLGDRVTITLRPAGGGASRAGAFRVQGIFSTGVREIDASWVEIPLDVAQRLANAGDGVTMIAAILRSVKDTEAFTARARVALAGQPLEVLPWQRAAPELYATILLDEGSMYLMVGIIFLVVAAGILNTILMGVLERTRELGVLLALGTPPRSVVRMILIEASFLGAAALGIGLVAGLAVNHYFAVKGLDVRAALGSDFETSGILLPDHFYSYLAPAKVAWSTVAVLALVLLGAIYPALRAARLQPVEAIRHV